MITGPLTAPVVMGWTCLISLISPLDSPAIASETGKLPSAAMAARPPEGFASLMEPQQILADVFFGGRSLGQARIIHEPGKITFVDVSAVVRKIPALKDRAAVEHALAAELNSNASLVCSPGHSGACGQLRPAVAGVIYDEDRFKVELFVSSDLLEVHPSGSEGYIAPPTAGLAVTTAFNAALAGTVSGTAAFNLQNRTLVGFQEYRLRSESSLSSSQGLLFDTLVGEVDKGSLRYSAGLFWAPGMEFIGDRKLLGAGVSTQLDTRADKELLRSTPLIVFLSQPALVEILRDGRLLSSERRDAGNQALDTSALPDGSYQVDLRIHEAGSAIRQEQRLFIKNRQMVPQGQPFIFAQAGYLTTDQERLFPSLSKHLFLQAGAAKRLSQRLGVDVTAVQYRSNVIGQLGATALLKPAQVRVAALAAARGDYGILLQAHSERSFIGFSFDLRRVWNSSNRPLLPLSSSPESFVTATSAAARDNAGSFTQASGNISLRLGKVDLAVVASYRKDSRGRTYTIGPRTHWNIVQRGGTFIALHAEATKSDRATAALVGIRIQKIRARSSFGGGVGAAYHSRNGSGGSNTTAVGHVNGSLQRSIGSTDLALDAGFERNTQTSVIRAGAHALGRFGAANADLQHDLGGGTTQYSINYRTSAAITSKAAAWGGRESSDSGVIVGIKGDAGDGAFELIIDGVPRGQLSAGGRLPVFLQPYRAYSVRIRPIDGPRLAFDASERQVSLYPGNVETLIWEVEPVVTAFGRAVRRDGSPAANADISSKRGVGRTDDKGFFQIEIGAADAATLKWSDGTSCSMKLGGASKGDYLPLGVVVCK